MRQNVLRIVAAGAAAAAAVAAIPALAAEHSVGTGPGNRFSPGSLTVQPGDTVTIRNTSGGSHNVRWEDRPQAEMAAFPPTGWSTSRTFEAADAGKTFTFYCEPHRDSGMTATVRVEAPTTTPTETGTQTAPTTPPPTQTQPGAPPPPGQTPAPGGDQTAPLLDVLRRRATRRGVVVRLRLSEAAEVTVRISRRGRRSVTRRRQLAGGTHSVRVRRRLARGRWRVRVSAVDAAGNTGAPTTVGVRVR